MLKGLALTPPIIGRISIGKVVEKNGKRLPEKDDQFTITTQVQHKGEWLLHPLDETLRKQTDNGKLRSIPIKLLFNDPDLNFRANYSEFDRKTGRMTYVNNEPNPNTSPDSICKPYGRLYVRLDESDELGAFIFRTTGYNSIRTIASRLRYFYAVSDGMLSTLPLELKIRGKSTVQSFGRPIYYVDLVIPDNITLTDAIAEAKSKYQERLDKGFNQEALDSMAKICFNNGELEDTDEEIEQVVEEFYNS